MDDDLGTVLARVLAQWEALADLTHGQRHNLGLGIRQCKADPCGKVNAFRAQIPTLVETYVVLAPACQRCRERAKEDR